MSNHAVDLSLASAFYRATEEVTRTCTCVVKEARYKLQARVKMCGRCRRGLEAVAEYQAALEFWEKGTPLPPKPMYLPSTTRMRELGWDSIWVDAGHAASMAEFGVPILEFDGSDVDKFSPRWVQRISELLEKHKTGGTRAHSSYFKPGISERVDAVVLACASDVDLRRACLSAVDQGADLDHLVELISAATPL